MRYATTQEMTSTRARPTAHAAMHSVIEPLEGRQLYSAAPAMPAADGPFPRVIGGSVAGIDRTVSGRAFNDKNGNGTRDRGEGGLRGRTVFLDANDNSKLDAGEQSAETGRGGKYAIKGVSAGNYKVRLLAVDGRRSTTAAKTVKAAMFSSHEIKDVDLGSTDTAQLAGRVYLDFNQNGVRDGTEPAGDDAFAVVLRGPGKHAKKLVAACNDQGEFEFSQLKPGTYTIETRVDGKHSGLQAPVTLTLAGGEVQPMMDVAHVLPDPGPIMAV
jgi:hypothetical protein